MKYGVDEALCSGQGQCYAVAPEVFSEDEDGLNSAMGKVFVAPTGSEDAIRDAVGFCPESAIRVFGDDMSD